MNWFKIILSSFLLNLFTICFDYLIIDKESSLSFLSSLLSLHC